MTQPVPENKIYITAKTRMTAEAKLRSNALVMHVLVGWYSFCLIVLSLGNLTNTYTIPYSDLLSVALSVGLFALSFFVYGEKYHERADRFRSCYLKLQELFNRGASSARKMSEYAKILDQFENHRNSDYDDMLFDAWIRGQKLHNATSEIEITLSCGVQVVIRRLIRFTVLAALFTAPVIVALKFAEPPRVECHAAKLKGATPPNGC